LAVPLQAARYIGTPCDALAIWVYGLVGPAASAGVLLRAEELESSILDHCLQDFIFTYLLLFNTFGQLRCG